MGCVSGEAAGRLVGIRCLNGIRGCGAPLSLPRGGPRVVRGPPGGGRCLPPRAARNPAADVAVPSRPRSPPRPSPGGLHYSDEDICSKYNGAVRTESMNLQEKSGAASESEVSPATPGAALPRAPRLPPGPQPASPLRLHNRPEQAEPVANSPTCPTRKVHARVTGPRGHWREAAPWWVTGSKWTLAPCTVLVLFCFRNGPGVFWRSPGSLVASRPQVGNGGAEPAGW